MSSFRFTYTDNNNSIVFGTESIKNWADIESNLTRSKSYRGRVRKVTNTFEFVGNVRNNYIMPNFDKNGTKAEATLLIEIGDDNFDEFTFTTLGSGFPMVADFNSYRVTETTAELNFVDSDFQQKISAGEKEKLNINTTNTLDGGELTDYTTLLKTISMHDRELKLNSISNNNKLSGYSRGFGNTGNFTFFTVMDSEIVSSSNDDVKNTVDFIGQPPNDEIETYFYLQSINDTLIIFKSNNFNINIVSWDSFNDVENVTDGFIELNFQFKVARHDIDYNFIDYQYESEVATITPSQTTSDDVNINIDNQITLNEGDSLRFEFHIFGETTLDNRGIRIKYSDDIQIITEKISYFARTTSNCILPHEFFTHWIEIMTGRKDAFYSTYFGRTDLGYEEDGEGAYLAIMDGHMIRNLDIEENPLNVSFKDMLEDFIKLKNLVAGIKYIGDTEVFSVDKYDEFYSTNTIIDIGDVINDIELEINEELTYSNISVGSKDLELEDLFGLDSPHGELNYSTPLNNTDETLDLILKSILNDYAIEQIRRKQFSIAPEEDTKNDKKIFIIDSKPWSTTDVIAKTNEGYTSITGVLSPNKMYNVNLVPSEQVRLWGNVINGCLQKEQDGQLILTKSASNNTLVREKDTGEIISEKDNINVSNLSTALITNQNITVNAPLEKVSYDIIEEDPNGLIKLTYKGIDFYSYLDLMSYKVSEKNANFTLNRSTR